MAVSPAFDSLVLADAFELLGGPGGYQIGASGGPFAGVIVRLNYGYDLSSPQTTVQLLAALSGDGERPYGRRASNRVVALPIMVDATQVTGTIAQQFSACAAALEQLMYLCDADTWRLVWTRRQGADPHQMPLVFDCFRAQPARVSWGGADGTLGVPVASLTLNFAALPYGRDDVPQTIDFQTPIAQASAPPAAALIDQFNNNFLSGPASTFEGGIAGWTATALCSIADSTTQAHAGQYSLAVTGTGSGAFTAQHLAAASFASGLPCVPGNAINASMWVRAAATSRNVAVQITYYTSGGAAVATHTGPSIADQTTAWSNISFSDTAPATAAFAVVGFSIAAGVLSEVHFVDDVVLANVSATTTTGGWGYQATGPSSGGAAFWDPSLPGLVNQPWQVSFHGNGSTAGPFAAAGTRQPVTALKQYVFDLWIMATGAVATGAINIQWWTALSGGSLITTTIPLTGIQLLSGVPVHVRGTAIAPLTAAAAVLAPGAVGTPAATTVFYLAGGTASGTGLSNAGQGTFTAGNSATVTNLAAWANAPGGTTGDYSQFVTGQGFGAPVWTNTAVPDVTIEGLTAITLWAGFGSTLHFPMWAKKGGAVRFVVTLTDVSGSTVTATKLQTCFGSDDVNAPRWTKIRVVLPHATGFNWADVTGYTLTITNRGDEMWFTRLYVSDVRGEPPADLAVPQPNGGVFYELHEVAGEARSQASLRVQIQGTQSTTQVYSNPGSYNWPCPAGTTSVNATVIGAGGTGANSWGDGSGGGGGGSAVSTGLAVTPGNAYPLHVAYGSYCTQLNTFHDPAPTQFSSDAATLTAGTGTDGIGRTTGGTGGAGSGGASNFTGGAGNAGNLPAPGGGGSSAGSAANGNAASGSTGGAAVTGGGPGGNAQTAPGNGGGGNPGGGAGGAAPGFAIPAAGGNGQVTLTYTGPARLQSLIAHRPGFDAPPEFVPFVPVPNTDTPAGAIQYPVPAFAAGVLGRLKGTYSVILCPFHWNTNLARTLTVTVTQVESTGGASYAGSVSATITPSNLPQLSATPSGTGFARLGEITIPLNLMAPDNTASVFTVAITSSDTADRFQDVLFLDTQGATVIVESPTPYANLWIDEPSADQDIGYVLGSVFDRQNAVSLMDRTTISGPPLDVDPYGNQTLLLYALEGVTNKPACQAYYFPRHFLERTIQ